MPKPDRATLERLAAVPLFASLGPKELASVAQAGQPKSYRAGDKVVAAGDKGIGFYLVLSGQVEVQSHGKTVATLRPGEFFGEMALFHEQERTADVVATAPTECLVLSSWEFWGVLGDKPEAMRTLMNELVRRLRATSHSLTE